MIEAIVNIALIAACMVAFYFVGRQHGQDSAIKTFNDDLSDLDDDFMYEDESESEYEMGYMSGFSDAKEIADVEYLELANKIEELSKPKKAAKKVSKKSK